MTDPRDVVDAMEALLESQGWGLLCERYGRETGSARFMGIDNLQDLGKQQGRVSALVEVFEMPRRILQEARTKIAEKKK